jgi:hypothetical protein
MKGYGKLLQKHPLSQHLIIKLCKLLFNYQFLYSGKVFATYLQKVNP